MATKDYKKSYSGIEGAGSVLPVSNTVSRDLSAGDKAFESVIFQSGKPILDSELDIHQDAISWENRLYRAQHLNSGWCRRISRENGYSDYTTGSVSGVSDDSGENLIDGTTLVNSFVVPKLTAIVAGRTVVIEYTNTSTANKNLIQLPEPPIFAPSTEKRTDFVWLEVWLALVAPSPRASGAVQVAAVPTAGNSITINGVALTAVAAAPGVNQFLIGADEGSTAVNIATAINDPLNGFATVVEAKVNVDIVVIQSIVAGVGQGAVVPFTGNFITLATVGAALVASGATLQNGADRPNKPEDEQSKLFRHGNVLSPETTWLDDEIVDPVVDLETAQRVQLQYRFRYTDDEAINYKIHPDGFSNGTAGSAGSAGADEPLVIAQGPRSTPALNVGGGRTYPFVPADTVSTWLESSAVAYAIKDNGLWIAGSGNDQSVKDLGTIDGYVYAIPMCFAFRHNDVSSFGATQFGFDPAHNSNGAPLHDHTGYAGPLGTIPAATSDRPDGEFADVLTENNILDLRRSVVSPGISLTSELQYQIQSLLDANNQTWAVDAHDKYGYAGGENGDVSTRFMVCNVIGRDHPGTEGGTFIREFDHVSRRFGSNPVVERIVFSFWPDDRQAAGAVAPGLVNAGKFVDKVALSNQNMWTEGDTLHLNLDDWDTHGLGSFFQGGSMGGVGLPGGGQWFTDKAPPGTTITDVLSIYHDDGHYDTLIDQQVQVSLIKGLGTEHLEITLDANGTLVTGGLDTAPGGEYPMVDSATPVADGSPRRIFVEVEITYPIGDVDSHGLTDTPLVGLTNPDDVVYTDDLFVNPGLEDFLPGPGPTVVLNDTQTPADASLRNAPGFREGFREVRLDYVTNNTDDWTAPDANPVSDSTSVDPLMGLVSRSPSEIRTPRRLFGQPFSAGGGFPVIEDVPILTAVDPDFDLTEYGSSSRKIVMDDVLSGVGHTLCNVTYQAQDPIPNYGDEGYTVMVYYRAAAPQTAGVIDGVMITSADDGGTVPTTLQIEPLAISPHTWTSQVGMGSVDAAFPYASPLDQIPIMEGGPTLGIGGTPTIEEWFFCASATVTIDDFDADTGMLVLQSMVQADQQPTWTLGGTDNYQYPRTDKEFRALYPYVTGLNGYRPTVMAQPLFGSTRHKVFVPVLARIKETVPGAMNGILFRQDELVLVVLTRFAELDEDNHLRFIGGLSSEGNTGLANAEANRTCAAVYRTRNLLLAVGGK